MRKCQAIQRCTIAPFGFGNRSLILACDAGLIAFEDDHKRLVVPRCLLRIRHDDDWMKAVFSLVVQHVLEVILLSWNNEIRVLLCHSETPFYVAVYQAAL